MKKENFDIDMIITRFENSNLSELEVTFEGNSIKCKKEIKTVMTTEAKLNNDVVEQKNSRIKYITSPIVGTFYRASSPDSNPFVDIGDEVNKNSTIAIIEAMKMMNELPSSYDCTILEVLVSNGDLVEFDQPLFKVELL